MDALFSNALSPRESPQLCEPRPLGTWLLPHSLLESLAGILEHCHLWWDPEFTLDGSADVFVREDRLVEEIADGAEAVLGELSAVQLDPSQMPGLPQREGAISAEGLTLFVSFRPLPPGDMSSAQLGLLLSESIPPSPSRPAQDADPVSSAEALQHEEPETSERTTLLTAYASGTGPHPQLEGDIQDEDWQALVARYAAFMGGSSGN